MKRNLHLNNRRVKAQIDAAIFAAVSVLIFTFVFAILTVNIFVVETAYAADEKVYSILKTETDEIAVRTAEGKEIYKENQFDYYAVKRAIDEDRNGVKFKLSIDAPEVTVASTVIDSGSYNPEDNVFRFDATVSHYLDNYSIEYKWFYKSSQDSDYSFTSSAYNTQIFFFGAGKPMGNYSVKVEARFGFLFDGVVYYSANEAVSDVAVLEGTISLAQLPAPECEYGTEIKNITVRDPLQRGNWEYQGTYDINDVLNAGNYTVNYRLVPFNDNFATLDNVPLNVVVVPKRITVIVDDKQSAEGKPLEELTYSLASSATFVGDDTVLDLNISLYKEGENSCGKYRIGGNWENGNYEVIFVNADNEGSYFSVGGIYTVLPVSISTVINGNVKITVYNENGFPYDAVLNYVKSEGGLPVSDDGAHSLGRYYFKIMDGADEIEMPENSTVTAEEFVIAVKYILFNGGDVWTRVELEDGKAQFTANAPFEICFAGAFSKTEYEDWNWATILLAVIITLLATGITVIAVKYTGRKRP